MKTEIIEKYSRVGYINLSRPVDSLVGAFVSCLPDDVGMLPPRWKYFGQEAFLKKYGHLGTTLLAKAANSHTVVCRGIKAARFWTDASHSAKVQVCDSLIPILDSAGIVAEDIPASNLRKSNGFTRQVKITKEAEARVIALVIRKVFDV